MTAKSDRINKLLDDKDLIEAFESVANAIHIGWANTPPTELESQQEWHRRLFTLNSIQENLYAAMQDGKYQDWIESEDEKPAELGDIVSWRMKQSKTR